MQKFEPLLHGQYYHIFNCGINGEPLFREKTNYEHFLRLYEKYIGPVADTFAWCLMVNHFHILVRIKDEKEIGFYFPLNTDRSAGAVRFKTTGIADLSESASGGPDSVKVRKPDPTKHFSHLFNAYARYYNIRYHRHGSLFERPFKRKHIDSEAYLKQVVIYIHNNPVHHGICNHPVEYGWSSYLTCISEKPTKIKRETVLEWFETNDHFEPAHNVLPGPDEIEAYLEL
jgi:putative transposase